ncbi:MAG TPA: IclR family transcriptional regulator [Gemmatimonadaceae bacterium]|nr:IclR family transcriptional regulator [Gemmatimonadaceae bacterium]
MKHDFSSETIPGTQAVTRAIALMKVLASHNAPCALTQLATEMKVNKAAVFRLLGALEAGGMVAREASSGDYRLGPQLISLGAAALWTTDVRMIAHEEIVRLTEETGETGTLEILNGSEVLILDEVQGRFLIGSMPEIGRRWAAHATSTGKVLLAFSQERFTPRNLRKLAPKTITSVQNLERELKRVRAHGYAVAVDELEVGFAAIAAPIRNHTGLVLAAISVNGPAARLHAARRRELIPMVCAAAERVSARIGASESLLLQANHQPVSAA